VIFIAMESLFHFFRKRKNEIVKPNSTSFIIFDMAIFQALLAARKNLEELQNIRGKMTRNEAIIRVKLTEEEEKYLTHNRQAFFDLLDGWSICWSKEDVELEKDFSQEELDKYTIFLFPDFSHCTSVRRMMEEVAARVYPEKPLFNATWELLGSCDNDSFTKARTTMTVKQLLMPCAENDDHGPYFITEEKWNALEEDKAFVEQVIL
jgi:hypothetical protein